MEVKGAGQVDHRGRSEPQLHEAIECGEARGLIMRHAMKRGRPDQGAGGRGRPDVSQAKGHLVIAWPTSRESLLSATYRHSRLSEQHV